MTPRKSLDRILAKAEAIGRVLEDLGSDWEVVSIEFKPIEGKVGLVFSEVSHDKELLARAVRIASFNIGLMNADIETIVRDKQAEDVQKQYYVSVSLRSGERLVIPTDSAGLDNFMRGVQE